MKQKATVIGTDNEKATISVERSSMCDGCHKKSCDGGCSMYKIFGADKHFEAVALNRAGAGVGDLVYVETTDKNVLLSAFIVFLLPIIIAFAVYAVMFYFFDTDAALVGAALSFVCYFFILALTERIRTKRDVDFVITEIIK